MFVTIFKINRKFVLLVVSSWIINLQMFLNTHVLLELLENYISDVYLRLEQ